jgi:hypothetical protein
MVTKLYKDPILHETHRYIYHGPTYVDLHTYIYGVGTWVAIDLAMVQHVIAKSLQSEQGIYPRGLAEVF